MMKMNNKNQKGFKLKDWKKYKFLNLDTFLFNETDLFNSYRLFTTKKSFYRPMKKWISKR